MGIGKKNIHRTLIKYLKDLSSVDTFVESGTYYGFTTKWASKYFKKVYTIELSDKIYNKAKKKLEHYSNIQLHNGDSSAVIPTILKQIESDAIFWLDGHWSVGETAGEKKECPLLDEIFAINEQSIQHIILIDDARLFTSPPPDPHDLNKWPNIVEVINALNRKFEYYIVIYQDIIIAVPHKYKKKVAKYLQKENTVGWNQYVQEIEEKKAASEEPTMFTKLKNFLG